MARFDIEVVSTADVPFPFPFPEVPAEAVPTTVVVGPDGAIYVGELEGFPFKTGSSHVWRIEPAADGVTCSITAPEPGCTVFQGGFFRIQDSCSIVTVGCTCTSSPSEASGRSRRRSWLVGRSRSRQRCC